MAEVKLVGLKKSFGDIVAINDISFDINDQEFVTMLGPTGAGKTTTLRCVGGLEMLDAGEVHVNGTNINALPPGQRNMALVSQHYALYPHLTVYKNLQFPLDKTTLSSDQKAKRIKEIAGILHIDHLLKRYPSKLSGGEMQRVVIGRAMVRSPQLFLLDEPLSNLDAKLREELRFELKRLQKEAGATTLFVTHDQIEAMSMSDKVIVIYKGVMQQVGTPLEIYSNPANILVSKIVGTPAMNLLPVEVLDNRVHIKSNGHFIDIPKDYQNKLSKGDYQLGIRPEDIKIVPDSTPGALSAETFLIEAFGYEKLIEISIGEFMVRARVSPRIQLKVGDPIKIQFEERKIRFFDTSGQLIRA
jgi:multiple sugar transport system ATP-binding protein